jgi:hypothetical protein
LKPYDIFLCYKKSSGKDFAEHLKSGLEELGLHTFIDSKDIPQMLDGKEEWAKIRNKAIQESKFFILLITPGFDLSSEVITELGIARKIGDKQFIYFRHRNLGRRITLDLNTEKVDLGKQQQVSFETKEELLRLAHNILFKELTSPGPSVTVPLESKSSRSSISHATVVETAPKNVKQKCLMCSKTIIGNPIVKVLGEKTCNFDSEECVDAYRKLKFIYGKHFE